jgi:hypothetical protein
VVELPDATRDRLDKLPARVIVEYLVDRFGPDVGAELVERATAGAELPIDTRSLLDLVAERLDMRDGHWLLEAWFSDGRLREIARKHRRIGATMLDAFDAPDFARR